MSRWVGSFMGEYSFLSNMYMCKFYYNSVEFNSVEEFYMLHKCQDPTYFSKLRVFAERPHRLKTESKKLLKNKYTLVHNWDDIKDKVMFLGLTLKFTQNPELMKKLLKTTKVLEEVNNWGDKYWGIVDGEGMNKLGIMLTEIRENNKKYIKVL